MYVLDSDVFTAYYTRENPSPPLRYRIESTPYKDLWITAVNVEESTKGALKLIQKYSEARDGEGLTSAYDLLLKVQFALTKPQILPFDKAALQEYVKIPRGVEKIVKARDCRIASIAVARGYTVVTFNERDFTRIQAVIPVKFVNWAS